MCRSLSREETLVQIVFASRPSPTNGAAANGATRIVATTSTTQTDRFAVGKYRLSLVTIARVGGELAVRAREIRETCTTIGCR